jgi:hypothetical protein
MRIEPFSSFLEQSLESRFVTDRHGKIYFFPRGPNKPGYTLTDPEIKDRYAKFISISLIIFVLAIIVSVTYWHSFWSFIIPAFGIGAVMVLIDNIYVRRITKDLPKTRQSYTEILLETMYPDKNGEPEEETPRSEPQFPSHPIRPISKVQSDPLLSVKRTLSHIAPGVYAIFSCLAGILIIPLWGYFFPEKVTENPFAGLAIFVVCFFWGLAGFILTINSEYSQKGIWVIFEQRSAWIFMMLFFWAFALYGLYLSFLRLF